uniref:SCP domain-containing protein n=1 Tax=Plectus sambesii TaxID=2011161 RepID=A0A914X7D7_9BILA
MVESNNMLAMMWDQSVADGAQQWADCCINSYSQASGVGETIYVQTGGAMDAQSNFLAAVTAWWSELTSAFAYNSPFNIYPGSSSAHNFTQLAWANTFTVGCGFAKCTNNIYTGQTAGFVVCHFSSQGNIAGQPIYNPNPGGSCNSGATCSFASQSSTCDSRGLCVKSSPTPAPPNCLTTTAPTTVVTTTVVTTTMATTILTTTMSTTVMSTTTTGTTSTPLATTSTTLATTSTTMATTTTTLTTTTTTLATTTTTLATTTTTLATTSTTLATTTTTLATTTTTLATTSTTTGTTTTTTTGCPSQASLIAPCDQAAVVTEINSLRSQLSRGLLVDRNNDKMVESNNMLAMLWDQSVADGAQQWADCCSNSYSQASGVGETIYVQTGGAMDAQSNFLAAVTAWWSELTSAFAYNSPFNIYPGSSSAHNFTQLAWANTYTVGCGFAKCTNNIFTGQTAGFVVCRFSSQ